MRASKFAVWIIGSSWLAATLIGCSDCTFEAKQIDRFLDAPVNQACSSDVDCVVEPVPNCLEVAAAFCGQVTLSRAASQSAQWLEIKEDAEGCEVTSCTQCGALRVPTCTDGACSR